MTVELPLPPHWDPARVEEVWRVDYEERATEAQKWGRSTESAPRPADRRRVALLLVDLQNTFCTPGFELFVPGAPDDNRRLCEFVYRNLGAITQIIPTLDTHKAMQVFHAAWLVDAEGRHPSPYTVVSAEDVESGVWWAADPAEQQALLSYVRALEAKGRYQLTIWPYHAMLGGIGHALVSAVEEAVFFHGDRPVVVARLPGQGRRPAHRALLGARARGRRPAERGARRSPARLRRGRHRRPGEEPLRRLDARRPARRRPRRARLSARGLHLAGRRPRRQSTSPSRRTRPSPASQREASTSSARRTRSTSGPTGPDPSRHGSKEDSSRRRAGGAGSGGRRARPWPTRGRR